MKANACISPLSPQFLLVVQDVYIFKTYLEFRFQRRLMDGERERESVMGGEVSVYTGTRAEREIQRAHDRRKMDRSRDRREKVEGRKRQTFLRLRGKSLGDDSNAPQSAAPSGSNRGFVPVFS